MLDDPSQGKHPISLAGIAHLWAECPHCGADRLYDVAEVHCFEGGEQGGEGE